jgi:hypothetical protein
MLPLELLNQLYPPYGAMLIQRDERPTIARGIWIPDRTRQSTRAAMATVIRVSPEVREFKPGDRLLLAATVGAKQVRLGARGELVLEVCKPTQVLAVLEEDGDLVENRGEHALANFTPAMLAGTPEPFDEGDPLAE